MLCFGSIRMDLDGVIIISKCYKRTILQRKKKMTNNSFVKFHGQNKVSVEGQLQNPEFRKNPENFHTCTLPLGHHAPTHVYLRHRKHLSRMCSLDT